MQDFTKDMLKAAVLTLCFYVLLTLVLVACWYIIN